MKRFIIVIVFLLFSITLCIYNFPLQSTSSSNLLYSIPKSPKKTAYLTFDDGPSKNVTPKVLDILDEENVTATFFVIGKKVEEHPEIVKDAYYRGHLIANHTYSHDNSMLYKSKEAFLNEIEKTEEAIRKAIGQKDYSSHLFRFPNGYMSPIFKKQKQKMLIELEKINFNYLDWNALNGDSMKKYTSFELLQNLKNSVKNQNTIVILMHDTNDVSDSSKVLKETIQYLKKEGYEFNSLEELLYYQHI